MYHHESEFPCAADETELLRFLCGSTVADARAKVIEVLSGHRWTTPDNAILFECIRDLFAHDAQHILAHLPAELTRRGFPDISSNSLREAPSLNSTAALALAEKLIRASQ